MSGKLYFNGEYLDYERLAISPDDRAYHFADGVYEVINFYDGRPFRMGKHFERLRRSAEGLEISIPDIDELYEVAEKLQLMNGFKNAKLYVQVSRGTQERSHAYNDGLTPNILMTCRKLTNNPDSYYQQGVECITVPDDRWARCYLKTIALLPNIMAKKKAKKIGAFEAIFVRDGFVMEGSSSNLFIVKDGEIITPPASNYILNGITRVTVLEIANKRGYKISEKSISLKEIYRADEVFLSGTTTEVMPVVRIDGRDIGRGIVGEISKKLHAEYSKLL